MFSFQVLDVLLISYISQIWIGFRGHKWNERMKVGGGKKERHWLSVAKQSEELFVLTAQCLFLKPADMALAPTTSAAGVGFKLCELRCQQWNYSPRAWDDSSHIWINSCALSFYLFFHSFSTEILDLFRPKFDFTLVLSYTTGWFFFLIDFKTGLYPAMWCRGVDGCAHAQLCEELWSCMLHCQVCILGVP